MFRPNSSPPTRSRNCYCRPGPATVARVTRRNRREACSILYQEIMALFHPSIAPWLQMKLAQLGSRQAHKKSSVLVSLIAVCLSCSVCVCVCVSHWS